MGPGQELIDAMMERYPGFSTQGLKLPPDATSWSHAELDIFIEAWVSCGHLEGSHSLQRLNLRLQDGSVPLLILCFASTTRYWTCPRAQKIQGSSNAPISVRLC